ncbi:MAG: hypothetical protein WKG00_40115 [Polyangiaceae bacterium]
MPFSQRQCLFAGVAILSFATVVLQITLTRLYSALFGNSMAFLAISLSLFGIGLGGVVLSVAPGLASPPRLFARLAYLSGIAALTTVVSSIYVLRARPVTALDLDNLGRLVLLYAVSSLPFAFVGVVIAAALRHAARDVSKLYLTDLAGAALGGIGAIVALRFGAPRATLVVGVMLAMGAMAFALAGRAREQTYEGSTHRPRLAVTAVFLCGTVSMLSGDIGAQWLKLPPLKYAPKIEFERWNEMALVTVDKPEKGMAWMRMDGSAATAILDPKTTPPLHPDEMPYVLHKEQGPVLVIGSGGGRDIRAALKAGQTDVHAAEINPLIVEEVMRGKYKKFSGDLYDKPEVHVAIADGRSYVRRSPIQFRNIVLSLVDTWSAASVGALALSENSLYTVEAFEDFLGHLEPEGTLLVNRWDAELERLLALAVAGLRGVGVEHPGDHLFACGKDRSTALLIKRTPLTKEEIRTLRKHCKKNKFTEAFAPDAPKDGLRRRLVTMPVGQAAPSSETELAPPTDDRPFFFYTVPARGLWAALRDHQKLAEQNQGLLSLVGLFAASLAVAAVALLVPLLAIGRRTLAGAGAGRSLLFFWCIGLGFVVVEVSLVQHLVMFLGHPVYALSAVLVVLLLSAGVGSLLTDRVALADAPRTASRRAEVLVALLAVEAVALGPVLRVAVGLPFVARLAITVLLVAPLGLLMGAQAPLAIKVISERAPRLIPWCWGVNGLASVVATAAGTLLALHAGFSALLLAGGLAYLVAVMARPQLAP